jgi:spermidine/putrescine transport system ATP-binding protein
VQNLRNSLEIEVENLEISYGSVRTVGPVSFSVTSGQQLTLLGPSGCGKTTTLRALAGLERPSGGEIRIGGRTMYSAAEGVNLPAEQRGLSMVFQSYAIWPHMTVYENVAFGLRVRRKSAAEIEEKVRGALDLVQMAKFADRHASQLSGGQQQRVALARALITEPKVLLLDEPLGALDRRLRQEMQVELKDIQRETGVTAIFVTHDQEEALTLSDRIAIIDQGRLIQVDAPQTVYERPANIFAANFLGDANVFRGTPVHGGLKLANGTIIETLKPSTGAAIVRPEKLRVEAGEKKSAGNSLSGEIVQAIYSGASVTYRIRVGVLGDMQLLAFIQNQTGDVLDIGAKVTVSWDRTQTIPVEP